MSAETRFAFVRKVKTEKKESKYRMLLNLKKRWPAIILALGDITIVE